MKQAQSDQAKKKMELSNKPWLDQIKFSPFLTEMAKKSLLGAKAVKLG